MYVGNCGDLNNGDFYMLKRKDDNQRERDIVLGQKYAVEFVKVENHKNLTREASGANADFSRTKYGRVYKMVLDANDPTKGELQVILDGDIASGIANEFQNPDNIVVTDNYAYIQEDSNGYGNVKGTNHDAYIYQYNLATGDLEVVFELDHRRNAPDVVEEILFSGYNADARREVLQEMKILSSNIKRLYYVFRTAAFTGAQILDAVRNQLFARTLFDKEAFDVNYFTPDYQSHQSAERVELGKMLFFEPVLSGNGSRSCASCHQPEKAFSDGKPKSIAFDFKGQVARNAPTVINAGLQQGLFHDLRVSFPEDQASAVPVNPEEMHGDPEKAVGDLKMSPEYVGLFRNAFPEAKEGPVTARHLKTAIASYIRSLTGFDSRFGQYMRGGQTRLTALEKEGFNLFAGKAKCVTCHFVPLFNGTVPPDFDKTEAEIFGVPASKDTLHPSLDSDPGKFALYRRDLHKFAFKTPTLRNVALTAPYMHNGVYDTLEEVVDFYNRGGGTGPGLDVPNQTLPADPLNLSAGEKKALVAFMHTLTDTSATRNVPRRLPFFPAQAVVKSRKVGGAY